ncbi:MAG: acyl carrier protein [Thermoanaerobaculia bacterium]
MTSPRIENDVKLYLLEHVLSGVAPDELTPKTPLISGGILDSLSALHLVQHLEESYGIRFEAYEVSVDYLDTMESIASLVASKLAARA